MKKVIVVGLALVMALSLIGNVNGEDNTYVGVKKCKMCHSKPKMGGVEYLKWSGAAHANAVKNLSSDKAKAAAAEMGIEDPATSEKCLKCHLTDLSIPVDKREAEGVGCERCHGPGSAYKSSKAMKDPALAKAAGIIMYQGADDVETAANTEKLCRTCHGIEHKDENPGAKEFNFAEYWPKIKHDEASLKAAFPDKF